MDDTTTTNNGDEADDPESHLQDVVNDVDLDSATEEEPLTLDPSTYFPSIHSLLSPLLLHRHPLTRVPSAQDPSLVGLREISSLASWSVSTHKPSCGVDALRNLNPSQFWQSDGPQPHLLTIHFFKLVKIVKMRVYLDFLLDESYTPTKMQFWGGTGMYDLVSLDLARSGRGGCGLMMGGWNRFRSTNGVVKSRVAGLMSILRASVWVARLS